MVIMESITIQWVTWFLGHVDTERVAEKGSHDDINFTKVVMK